MDSPPIAPLTAEKPATAEEAKERLVVALDRCSPTHWVRAHPWGSIGIGFLGGYILGTGRITPTVLNELAYYLAHTIAEAKHEPRDPPR